MPKANVWTEAQDLLIKRMRAEGHNWDAIGAALGITRWGAMERGRRIGAKPPPPDFTPPPPDPNREPLPAGSPESWGAITHDTVLSGAEYVRIPPR
jgi:hypothetical protein